MVAFRLEELLLLKSQNKSNIRSKLRILTAQFEAIINLKKCCIIILYLYIYNFLTTPVFYMC
jgi:hypothetical protein